MQGAFARCTASEAATGFYVGVSGSLQPENPSPLYVSHVSLIRKCDASVDSVAVLALLRKSNPGCSGQTVEVDASTWAWPAGS